MIYIWIPIVVAYYFLYAYITKECNVTHSRKYVGILFLMQALGLWPIIAYFSKNVLRDGVLFDVMILLGFYSGMIYFKAAENFTPIQWIGLILSLIGIWMMK